MYSSKGFALNKVGVAGFDRKFTSRQGALAWSFLFEGLHARDFGEIAAGALRRVWILVQIPSCSTCASWIGVISKNIEALFF